MSSRLQWYRSVKVPSIAYLTAGSGQQAPGEKSSFSTRPPVTGARPSGPKPWCPYMQGGAPDSIRGDHAEAADKGGVRRIHPPDAHFVLNLALRRPQGVPLADEVVQPSAAEDEQQRRQPHGPVERVSRHAPLVGSPRLRSRKPVAGHARHHREQHVVALSRSPRPLLPERAQASGRVSDEPLAAGGRLRRRFSGGCRLGERLCEGGLSRLGERRCEALPEGHACRKDSGGENIARGPGWERAGLWR